MVRSMDAGKFTVSTHHIRSVFRWNHSHLVYECGMCHTAFRWWMVYDDVWKESGFGADQVCKACFEKVVPNPEYVTNWEDRPITPDEARLAHLISPHFKLTGPLAERDLQLLHKCSTRRLPSEGANWRT